MNEITFGKFSKISEFIFSNQPEIFNLKLNVSKASSSFRIFGITRLNF